MYKSKPSFLLSQVVENYLSKGLESIYLTTMKTNSGRFNVASPTVTMKENSKKFNVASPTTTMKINSRRFDISILNHNSASDHFFSDNTSVANCIIVAQVLVLSKLAANLLTVGGAA